MVVARGQLNVASASLVLGAPPLLQACSETVLSAEAVVAGSASVEGVRIVANVWDEAGNAVEWDEVFEEDAYALLAGSADRHAIDDGQTVSNDLTLTSGKLEIHVTPAAIAAGRALSYGLGLQKGKWAAAAPEVVADVRSKSLLDLNEVGFGSIIKTYGEPDPDAGTLMAGIAFPPGCVAADYRVAFARGGAGSIETVNRDEDGSVLPADAYAVEIAPKDAQLFSVTGGAQGSAGGRVGVAQFVIEPKLLTVKVDPKLVVAGQSILQTQNFFSSTITGFVNGDTVGSVTPGAYVTGYTPLSPPGIYVGAITLTTGSAANYTVPLAKGTLIVMEASYALPPEYTPPQGIPPQPSPGDEQPIIPPNNEDLGSDPTPPPGDSVDNGINNGIDNGSTPPADIGGGDSGESTPGTAGGAGTAGIDSGTGIPPAALVPTLPGTPAPTESPPEIIGSLPVPSAPGPDFPLPDNMPPFSPGNIVSWALFNLLLMLATVLLLVFPILRSFVVGRREGGRSAATGRSMLQESARLFCFIPAALSIAMFAVTENLTSPFIMVNKYTAWHLALLAIQAALGFLARGRRKEADLDDDL
jgi:hypothetical protein